MLEENFLLDLPQREDLTLLNYSTVTITLQIWIAKYHRGFYSRLYE